MISVVIPTMNSARLLPRCFDSLIGAVVRGIVRDVVIADGGSSDETLAIADAAGAAIAEGGRTRGAQMAAGAAAARSDWLLFLHPETALEQGWENEADSFLEKSTLERPRAAVFRFAIDDFDARARRTEAIVSVRSNILGQPCGGQGLLIPKRFYQKLGGYRAAPTEDIDLVRRIRRSRIVTLRSRAVNKVDRVPAQRLALGMLHALRVPKRLVAYIGR
jgi:glycosyltransferase involved in cell wall biosynthesis